MRFAKLHGLGNDFVVVDRDALPGERIDELARRVCDRRRGIGADGLLVVGPREADGAWRLLIVNADGSRAAACGNGARCVARNLGAAESFLRTDAERVRVTWDGRVASVTLRAPRLGRRQLVALDAGDTPVRAVDVGNPHAVVLGIPPEDLDLVAVARAVRERLGDANGSGSGLWPHMPERFGESLGDSLNVGVAALDGRDAIRLRVDERGVGETLACGTGACAAVAAARAEGWVGDRVLVRLPGGELDVSLEGDAIVLRGPAEEVFRGEWRP